MGISAALTSLVRTSKALRTTREGSFSFEAFIEALNRQATALSRYKLPGDHVHDLTEKLTEVARIERPLGAIGASALLKKLEAWHLLPPIDRDPVTVLRHYRQEIEYEEKGDWEDGDIDWSRIHPIHEWVDDFKFDEAEGDINYESYLRKKISVPGYHHLCPIAEGSGGMIFKAESEAEPSRTVAIKVFPISWNHKVLSYVFVENNLRPKLAAVAEHSALLVTAKESGFTNLGDPYVVMEYVEGHILSTQRRIKDFSRALTAGQELVSGIASLHREGLVHRDISPNNILVTDAHLRLIDFDMLTHERELRREQLQDSQGEGTPGYMPPESWKGSPPNFRFDVFGLSATLYLLLTGKKPFGELAAMMSLSFMCEEDEIESELKKPAVPPRKINRRISSKLNDILLRGLSLDPSERHENAIHFQEEFLRAIV